MPIAQCAPAVWDAFVYLFIYLSGPGKALLYASSIEKMFKFDAMPGNARPHAGW